MSFVDHVLITALGLSATSPALAQGVTYDCDTRAGHYSSVQVVQIGDPKAVVGTVMAKTLVKSSDFSPVGSAALASADDKMRVMVRMGSNRVTRDDVTTGTIHVGIILIEKGKEPEEEYFASTNMQQPIRFKIEPLVDSIRVTFGGTVRVFPFKIGPNPVASASCSTGQFVFRDLELAAANIPE